MYVVHIIFRVENVEVEMDCSFMGISIYSIWFVVHAHIFDPENFQCRIIKVILEVKDMYILLLIID